MWEDLIKFLFLSRIISNILDEDSILTEGCIHLMSDNYQTSSVKILDFVGDHYGREFLKFSKNFIKNSCPFRSSDDSEKRILEIFSQFHEDISKITFLVELCPEMIVNVPILDIDGIIASGFITIEEIKVFISMLNFKTHDDYHTHNEFLKSFEEIKI